MDEEFKSALRKFLIVGLTVLATKLHMSDVSWILPVATDAIDLGVIAWGLYAHRGMKKVPVNLLLAALAISALLSAKPAVASDLPNPVVTKAPVFAPVAPCTVQACSGWYVGGELVGLGSNLDILGSGINGSIFAGGGMLGLNAGYQLWNGRYFAALELGGDYDVTNTLNASGHAPFTRRFAAYQVVKLGYGLQGLLAFPTAAPSPGQGPAPINVPASIANALASPYLQFGAFERVGVGTGWLSGAGAEFIVAQNWTLDINYKRVQYQGLTVGGVAVKDENLVSIGVRYIR